MIVLRLQMLAVVLYALTGALTWALAREENSLKRLAEQLFVATLSCIAVYFALGIVRGPVAVAMVVAQHVAVLGLILAVWVKHHLLRVGAALLFGTALALALYGLGAGLVVGR